MTIRNEWKSIVRLSELGPDGIVHPQRVTEWFQDAAAHASTLGGFPPDRYGQMGAAWVIRDFQFTIEGPLSYGMPYSIETWVSSLRRFRTHREYVLRSEGQVLARGQADWLFLERDPASGKIKPRMVDEEMKTVFPRFPDIAIPDPEILPWRDTAPPPTASRAQRAPQPNEIDRYGHVNHTIYVRWLEDHATTTLGPTRRLTAMRIEYLADSKPGEEVELTLEEHDGGVTQWLHRGEVLLVRAESRRSA